MSKANEYAYALILKEQHNMAKLKKNARKSDINNKIIEEASINNEGSVSDVERFITFSPSLITKS